MTNPYGNQPQEPQQNNDSSRAGYGQLTPHTGEQNYQNQPYETPSYAYPNTQQGTGHPYPNYSQYNTGNSYANNAQYGFSGGINNGLSKPRPHVGFKQAISNYFKYMFHFSGRASRSEFWWVQLLWFLIMMAVLVVGIGATFAFGASMPENSSSSSDLTGSEAGFLVSFLGTYFGIIILALVQFVTTLGLNWRRVQDTGVHGAVSLVGLTGLPIMLVFGFIPSSPNGYQYDAPKDYDRP